MNEENRKLRHDRHTVSLLTDHLVFSPKYRGKVLVGDVANISGHRAAFMGVWGRDGRWYRSILKRRINTMQNR